MPPSVGPEKSNAQDDLGDAILSVVAAPRTSEQQRYTHWDRARLSVVVPIGVIVAVAIVCIVVAVLSSAQRADVMAVEHERSLLSRALANEGERVLREVESVATAAPTVDNIRAKFNYEWAVQRIGLLLARNFEHDYVVVLDGADRPLLTMSSRNAADTAWFADGRPDDAPPLPVSLAI